MAKLIFMGTPNFAVPSLAALNEHHEIVAVITQPDAPAGRGKELKQSAVKQFAVSRGLNVLQPESLKAREAVEQLRAFEPDAIVVAAFGQILRQNVLDIPRFHCINVHASLLPRWRGAAPVAASIANGDSTTGVTIMLMEAGLDSGPILSQREERIRHDDTTGKMTERLAKIGASLLIETLPKWFNHEIKPRKQDESLVTLCGRITKEQGKIDWSRGAMMIERHIRAMTPWPSAFTTWQGKHLKILRATATANHHKSKLPNGKITVNHNHVYVECGDGSMLQLVEVQLEGKRAITADAFARGQKGLDGSLLV
jgi:methionyl-tRNA formyltransferase